MSGNRDVNPVLEVIRGRLSAERFDPAGSLTEGQIRELVEDAIEAPSSFNIQHWRFVAIRKPEDKKRLRAAAHGQAAVEQAAVTFIVLGDLRAHEQLPEILETSIAAGVMSRDKARRWIESSNAVYADPQLARDEAIRSASLAVMTLMLSASARGLASGALIGFDPARVRREFGIADRYLPVMLLAVGPAAGDPAARKVRLPVDRVLAFDRGRDF